MRILADGEASNDLEARRVNNSERVIALGEDEKGCMRSTLREQDAR
jgi:hypothetical protein